MDRAALAAFLRRRREALLPEDVGLPPGARRRAPGLRREEVAALAAMSTDYYTRLEQRRGPQPSEQMLSSLARTLRLTANERDYLFRIAGRNAPSSVSPATHVAPALLRVLDSLDHTPALIMSNLGETLVQNRMAEVLFGDRSGYTGLARSEIYRWFTDPSERLRYPEEDRDRQSRAQVANLRAAYGSMGPQSRAGELVRTLHKVSAEFGDLWERHEVAKRFEDHKTLIHPELGAIEVDCQALLTEDQSQALLVLTAAPHTEDFQKLQLLRVLGHEQFAADERPT
jgi:transcriptional regulator with XRE-family HTH domain